ncbi:ATP synthase F1 subunit delta [PVC group bacterium]|nr:ATP synthase F1 subunit delta [PVC group bacterium]
MQPEKNESSLYAHALIVMGQACNALSQIEADMLDMLEMLKTNAEIKQFLSDPFVKPEGKSSALEEILKDKIHPILIHFLIILLSQNQLRKLETISTAFFHEASKLREQISGDIHTGVPLSAEKLKKIEKEVGAILDKKVHLRHSVAPGILGGVYVKVGDFVIDGTIEYQLEEIRRQLTL